MSFQTAMLRLGGTIIGFDNPANSSVSKGETIKDTTKIVSNYADVLVIRHPVAGAAKAASLTSDCSVINAGDGGHLHPTQTLTDLLTLKIEKQTLSGLTIGMCGDLLNGRTVHSLCKALSMFENNKFVFISTSQLGMPAYIKDIIKANGSSFTEVNTLEEAIGSLDVLYMTRIQQERFASEEEYLAQKNTYVLDKKKMLLAAKDMIEGNQQKKTIADVIFKVTEENAQEVLDQLWKTRGDKEQGGSAAKDSTSSEEEAADPDGDNADSDEAGTSSAATTRR